MGVEYLSDVWAKELTESFNGDRGAVKTIEDESALIQMNVSGTPRGDVGYYFKVGDGRFDVVLGSAEQPDAESVLDYDTSVALSTGEINGANAMMAGRMKITGDIPKVLRIAAALDLIPEVSKAFEIDY